VHVYEGGVKIDQATGNAMSGMVEMIQTAAKASNPVSSAAAAGAASAGGSPRKPRPSSLPPPGFVHEVATHDEWKTILRDAGNTLVVADFTAVWLEIPHDWHIS